MRIPRIITLALFCCLLSACTPVARMAPVKTRKPLSSEEAGEVLKQLSARVVPPQRRLFNATFRDGEEQYTLRLAFLFSPLDNIRIELLPLNTSLTLKLLTSRGGQATYVDLAEKFVVYGSLRELLELSFLEADLRVPELLNVLGGELVYQSLDADVEVYQLEGGYLFYDERSYIETNKDFEVLTFEIVDDSGDILIRGNRAGGSMLVELVSSGQSLQLTLLREKTGKPIPVGLFTPVVPRGFSERHL